MLCTVDETREMLETLGNIFDIARIADPVGRKILRFGEDGSVTFDKYYCHAVWNKDNRCANCVSLYALRKRRRCTKYEFIDDDVYYVVSKPMTVALADGKNIECVLELVSKVTDEALFDAVGKDGLVRRIIESEKRVYIDSLTGVFNRRYFDEHAFCLAPGTELDGARVAFVTFDINRFKEINDTYGHTFGDVVLKGVASALSSCVEVNVPVMRIGGDEFLIILRGAGSEEAEALIKKAETRLSESVVYDKKLKKHAVVDSGYSCTDNFVSTDECIGMLTEQADRAMYANKKNR